MGAIVANDLSKNVELYGAPMLRFDTSDTRRRGEFDPISILDFGATTERHSKGPLGANPLNILANHSYHDLAKKINNRKRIDRHPVPELELDLN